MVLVTGGTGLVGSHLLYSLVSEGESVRAIYRDKSKINKSRELFCTHKEIAFDLNSSRVVISRLLKVFEQKNRIRLRQGVITLKD